MEGIPNSTHDMPRERMLRAGAASLTDHELLAVLLRTGNKGKNVLDFARDLLQVRGGLVGLFNSRPADLQAIKGLGKAKIAEILAVTELARRFMTEEMRHSSWSFASPDDVREYLMMQFKGQSLESFGVLFLNQKHGFIAFERLATGTAGMVAVPVRSLFASALHHSAAAVILVHNHPAGSHHPSQDDREITQQIDAALRLMEIRLLDHFIVAGNTLVSMRECGGW
ncbi:MAG: DNA repair protein RadC [Cardiobacteriaceae bacterium]|nr:DNA repair protein RadC [Cardiobacteriaceae bacterium]